MRRNQWIKKNTFEYLIMYKFGCTKCGFKIVTRSKEKVNNSVCKKCRVALQVDPNQLRII